MRVLKADRTGWFNFRLTDSRARLRPNATDPGNAFAIAAQVGTDVTDAFEQFLEGSGFHRSSFGAFLTPA